MDMQAILERQKAAHLRDGEASAALRIERIDRCIRLLRENRREIEEALNTDFGSRSREATAFTDIAGSIGPLPTPAAGKPASSPAGARSSCAQLAAQPRRRGAARRATQQGPKTFRAFHR